MQHSQAALSQDLDSLVVVIEFALNDRWTKRARGHEQVGPVTRRLRQCASLRVQPLASAIHRPRGSAKMLPAAEDALGGF